MLTLKLRDKFKSKVFGGSRRKTMLALREPANSSKRARSEICAPEKDWEAGLLTTPSLHCRNHIFRGCQYLGSLLPSIKIWSCFSQLVVVYLLYSCDKAMCLCHNSQRVSCFAQEDTVTNLAAVLLCEVNPVFSAFQHFLTPQGCLVSLTECSSKTVSRMLCQDWKEIFLFVLVLLLSSCSVKWKKCQPLQGTGGVLTGKRRKKCRPAWSQACCSCTTKRRKMELWSNAQTQNVYIQHQVVADCMEIKKTCLNSVPTNPTWWKKHFSHAPSVTFQWIIVRVAVAQPRAFVLFQLHTDTLQVCVKRLYLEESWRWFMVTKQSDLTQTLNWSEALSRLDEKQ